MNKKNIQTKNVQLANGEILLYQSDTGDIRIDVKLLDETVWLTQLQMAELFQKDKRTISEHIQNIFAEKELAIEATVRNFRTVQNEGTRQVMRDVAYFNLDVIISVGYRVKSHRGTQFRIWATQRLREYLIKGFTLDDERLKEIKGANYFNELLARIRDIRSSEKIFWRKVLEIFATSIDYTPNTDLSHQFFKIMQNKIHWAAHGHTAAEIISSRADAKKPNMGLTSWVGDKPARTDSEIAKNYLNQQELEILNRLVSMYLDFAELQAMNRRPMYMQDWMTKLDEFLKLSEREILRHAGKISHQQAIDKAHAEYNKFDIALADEPTAVEKHFLEAIKTVERLAKYQKKEAPTKI